jgi:hypothetical protein
MKCTHISTVFASLALVTCFSIPALAVIVDNNTAGYSETGTWVTSDSPGHPRTVNDSYRASNTGGSTATYAPGLSGQYFIQVHWGLHPAHSASALYTVNDTLGAHPYAANQKQSAAQGAPNTFLSGSSLPVEGSGWYSLGGNGTLFTLNGSSNVTLTRTAGTDHIIADAIRFSNSFVADERAAALTGTWSSIATNQSTGGEESTQYLSTGNTSATVTYKPGVSGYFDLAASWGIDSTNTTAAQYLLDIDGNLGTTTDQTSFLINQQLLSDQLTGGLNADWSGYRPLFSTLLNANSLIQLSNTLGSGTLSSDGLQLAIGQAPAAPAPEPSTLVLFGLGAIGLGMKSRRRRNAA